MIQCLKEKLSPVPCLCQGPAAAITGGGEPALATMRGGFRGEKKPIVGKGLMALFTVAKESVLAGELV